ncbi:MAG: hypothetical protein ACP5II_07570 [Infirmifilum sp.]|jgi:hypothetical protein|uniref:Uncharacterized protein n=1 Tax=Infirmifilum uzonense TaxID=1550241 RepID=A0A0F7FJ80_9CREN|nr:hypothetical protein [Infirmifilum uzonense]AKG38925.1 hypothetical protein MA03_06230 [Infirmifilum uzonense]
MEDKPREEKEKLLEHLVAVVEQLLSTTKSNQISIKLRTLLRYAYVSYVKRTTDINVIRGLVPRVRPPAWLTNQYYYREIEGILRQRFNARIENRRQFRYVVFQRNKG